MTTKDAVLAMLLREQGYVSGERMSEAIGVSRMAVSGAAKALRGEGYEIESVTNRGYIIKNAPERLSAGELAARLGDERAESIICLDEADSTNRALREAAENGAGQGSVVIACGQRTGRGRQGRSFFSPKGKGVYLSYLMRPECSAAASAELTAWAAVAARRAVARVCGARVGIKWVNDLMLGGKKLGGILTEMSIEAESGAVAYAVVGVGININTAPDDFGAELCGIATSLAAETGKPQSRADIAAALITELDAVCKGMPHERAGYLAEYRATDTVCGHEVVLVQSGGESCAEALAINDDFSLLVRDENGNERSVRSGEVRVRPRG